MTTQEAIEFFKKTKAGSVLMEDKEVEDACDIAISAILKQRPLMCRNFRDICSCGTEVYPHMNYCRSCGQALDWSKKK